MLQPRPDPIVFGRSMPGSWTCRYHDGPGHVEFTTAPKRSGVKPSCVHARKRCTSSGVTGRSSLSHDGDFTAAPTTKKSHARIATASSDR